MFKLDLGYFLCLLFLYILKCPGDLYKYNPIFIRPMHEKNILATFTYVCAYGYALISSSFGYGERWFPRMLGKNLKQILAVYWHAALEAARTMNNTLCSNCSSLLLYMSQSSLNMYREACDLLWYA